MNVALREGDLDVLLLKLSLNGLVDIKEYSPVIRCLGPDTEVEVQAAFAEGRQARGGLLALILQNASMLVGNVEEDGSIASQ